MYSIKIITVFNFYNYRNEFFFSVLVDLRGEGLSLWTKFLDSVCNKYCIDLEIMFLFIYICGSFLIF